MSTSLKQGTTTQSTEQVRSSVGTAIPPTTTSTTTWLPTTAEQYSTENEIGTGLPQQQLGPRGRAERTALIVVAVFASGLLLCLLGVTFMLMWNRRQLR